MTKILGNSVATAKQMSTYLLSVNKNPKFSKQISALDFCQLFIDVCAKEGVRGDLAFAQSCKETGNFNFNGDVEYTQNNFAGLGATGGGVKGCIFNSIEEGILAQAQHLKTYATKDELNEKCVDPRRTNWFVKVKSGTSPHIETLGGTWAVPGYNTSKYSSLEAANKAQDSYGYDILKILNKILNVKEEEKVMAYKVALDAGHGSNTAGKRTPDGYREHWINTKCANFCKDALNRCGIAVFKSSWDDEDATDDSDIALSKRQLDIKNADCDISVSIHANAFGDGKSYNSAEGIETFVHSNISNVLDSRNLANNVQKYLIQGTLQKNRGVKSANFAMCNARAMGVGAAILIEMGFMTNIREAELMQNDAFLKETAEEIAHGVCDYLGVRYVAPNEIAVVTPPVIEEKPAEENKFPYKVKITANVLNVRKGPSTKNAVVTTVRKNGVYTIVDEENGWGLLTSYSKNRNGWISLKYTVKR